MKFEHRATIWRRIHGRSVQLLTPGGILSPEALGEIARAANKFGAELIRSGAFQDLWIDFPNRHEAAGFCHSNAGQQLYREIDGDKAMLISSVSSVDYESTTPWLTESIYFDLLYTCSEVKRSFSLSICDPRQTLTPLCSCDVNLLASPIQHHWHLVLADRRGERVTAPFLLPTFIIHQILIDLANMPLLNSDIFEVISRNYPDSLIVPEELPAVDPPEKIAPYEGFLGSTNAQTQCLGIFRGLGGFRPLFLDELAYLCRKHSVGRIFLTSLHSLFIKNIQSDAIDDWKSLISRHGLNLRHDEVSLNWQVEEGFEDIRSRMIQMLRSFDAAGGLSYAVGSQALQQDMSIAIVPARSSFFRKRYRLYFQHGFRRHSRQWHRVAADITFAQLGRHVRDLCQLYYNQFTLSSAAVEPIAESPFKWIPETRMNMGRFECIECLTRYDPEFGDPRHSIAPGHLFENLPADYACSVCGSDQFQKCAQAG